MKRSIPRAFALCFTTAFVAGQVYAQSEPDKLPTTQGVPGTTSGYTSGTSLNNDSARSGQAARLSKLMNTNLKGQTGESLGQVQEIIMDPASGQIQFVVLSMSDTATAAQVRSSSTSTENSVSSPRSAPSRVGSYGTVLGGRLVAVPWRLISSSGSDQYTASVDAAKLQSAPAFSSTTWPTMDSAWSQRVYAHFGVDAPATGSRTSGIGAPGSDSGTGTGVGTGTGTGLGNPSTPGLPSTPGTPDITPPTPGTVPGTTPNALPGTVPNATSGTVK